MKTVTVHLCEVAVLPQRGRPGEQTGRVGQQGTLMTTEGEHVLNDRLYGGPRYGVGVGPVTCK